ncbi:unnamed protein product [Amoebophrya sp. A25]|nr:unnamed protein product [Amoebophrya sp. A25]|eukprot:GSA25T00004646001.1
MDKKEVVLPLIVAEEVDVTTTRISMTKRTRSQKNTIHLLLFPPLRPEEILEWNNLTPRNQTNLTAKITFTVNQKWITTRGVSLADLVLVFLTRWRPKWRVVVIVTRREMNENNTVAETKRKGQTTCSKIGKEEITHYDNKVKRKTILQSSKRTTVLLVHVVSASVQQRK